jgi:hypothetical protein
MLVFSQIYGRRVRAPIPVHSLAFFFVHHFKDFEKKMENVGQPPPSLCENSCINFSVSYEC